MLACGPRKISHSMREAWNRSIFLFDDEHEHRCAKHEGEQRRLPHLILGEHPSQSSLEAAGYQKETPILLLTSTPFVQDT